MSREPSESWSVQSNLHDWELLNARLLFVYDNPLPATGMDGFFERREEYSVQLVRDGWMRIEADGQAIEVGPGEWLINFADRMHQRIAPRTHLLSIRLAGHWPDGQSLFHGKTFVKFAADAEPHMEGLARQLFEDTGGVSWQQQSSPMFLTNWTSRLDLASYVHYQQHLFAWMAALTDVMKRHGVAVRVHRGVDVRLARALHLIDSLGWTEPFPQQAIADMGELTPGQLKRMCLQAYGQTLRGYWEQRRLRQAIALLEQRPVSVKEVAHGLGFVQLSHFSAWFKRHAGSSPRAYRTTATDR